MKRLFFVTALLSLVLSSQTIKAQFWTLVNEGITGIADGASPFAICSDANNLYVSYPISYSDSTASKSYCVVGIQKWNGVFWQKMPSVQIMINWANYKPEITCMTVYNGELYMAGNFQRLPSEQASLVIKYNGNTWGRVGTVIDNGRDSLIGNRVNCMKVYKDKLYLGGIIDTSLLPSYYPHLIIWDGNNRTTHDSLGFNDEVLDMEVVNDTLYIAGKFTYVNNNQVERIASWNDNFIGYLPNPSFDFYQIPALGNYRNNLLALGLTNDSFSAEGLFKYRDTWTHLASMPTQVSDMQEYENKLWISGLDNSSNYINWIWNDTILYYDTNNKFTSYKLNVFKSDLYSLHYEKSYDTILYNYISKLEDKTSLVSGHAYYDMDYDCEKDDQEPGINDVYLELNNASTFKPTEEGVYTLSLSSGTHTLAFDKGVNAYEYYVPENCISLPYTLNLNKSNTYSNYDFPLVPLPDIEDLGMKLSAYRGFRARQGFEDDYIVKIQNLGTKSISNVVATLFYDTSVTFINADITPEFNQNNEIRWQINQLAPQEKYVIKLKFRTSLYTNLNDTVRFIANVKPTLNDQDSMDNYDTLIQYVAAAIDPNDKQAYPSGQITKQTTKINYVINFQNMGNDTAYKVVVVDTIDYTKLKLNKIYMNQTSHPCQFSINGNVFIWTFDNILLPDSTTDESKSKGFISYTAHINPSLNIGDSILNKADIFFDFQKPVTTNYATLKVVSIEEILFPSDEKQLIRVYPNPASQSILINSEKYNIKEIKIYSLAPKLIRHIQNLDQNEFLLDVGDLAKGLYIIEVRHGNALARIKVQVLK